MDNIEYTSEGKGLISDAVPIRYHSIFIDSDYTPVNGKSLLTKQLTKSSVKIKRSPRILRIPDEDDPNLYSINVKVLDNEDLITLNILKRNTVGEVIEHVLQLCKEQSEFTCRLPYRSSKGYDLRPCIGGDPIYEISPLERHIRLGYTAIDEVAFCVNKKYAQSTATRKSKENDIYVSIDY